MFYYNNDLINKCNIITFIEKEVIISANSWYTGIYDIASLKLSQYKKCVIINIGMINSSNGGQMSSNCNCYYSDFQDNSSKLVLLFKNFSENQAKIDVIISILAIN